MNFRIIKNKITIAVLVLTITTITSAYSQDSGDLPNKSIEKSMLETPLEDIQNPRYVESYLRYSSPDKIKELTMGQGTTIQDTYKAIDPWQDKKDARRERRNNRYKLRHERKLAGADSLALWIPIVLFHLPALILNLCIELGLIVLTRVVEMGKNTIQWHGENL